MPRAQGCAGAAIHFTDKGEPIMQVPEIVVVLHRAIDQEKESLTTYLQLAKVIKDVKAKNVLINLASDEVGHMNKLEDHLTSVLQGKSWVLSKVEEAEATAAVLTKSAKLEKIDPGKLARADEIRILEIAIDKEIRANKAYLDLAKAAASEGAREMFLALAKEEDLHARILTAEVDSIGQNGFWFDMQEFTMEQPEG
ncbi:MAG: ferritin family protein [Deltaproteobacteria bacterium]|nr:ferritin family protein [Deltaproteobacteria bacterium]